MPLWHDRLREFRVRTGLSQGALADAAGVSLKTVSNYELALGLSAATTNTILESSGSDLDAASPSYVYDFRPSPAPRHTAHVASQTCCEVSRSRASGSPMV